MAQYEVNNSSIQTLLSWIRSGEIAIPEIQRPFVWNAAKVRDLIDSLYAGFPVGYIIIWKNPDVRLKDGSLSSGKKILIDGQQRIMALQAAIVGEAVLDGNYKTKRIQIAFHPLKGRFEVASATIRKDPAWIADIAPLYKPGFDAFNFVIDYCDKNHLEDDRRSEVNKVLTKLQQIQNNNIGVIELSHQLDIEEVTEIFIRINAKGVVLSQADFAMSKVASEDQYGGVRIRKTIDYFCHLLRKPEDLETIRKSDADFATGEEFAKITWLSRKCEKTYTPDYTDVLRVVFTFCFLRGRISDLVSLLSGRDFETREYREDIAKESFCKLREGVLEVISETNFRRYLMIVRSTGIIAHSMIRSQNVLNFGYALYLLLRKRNVDAAAIEKVVRRWLVLTILTGRYSGSPESSFDYDIKRFNNNDPVAFLEQVEAGELSDAFWNKLLVTKLETSVASSPMFNLFLMAQVKMGDHGFLSDQIDVKSLIEERGDVHHIFPKRYLQKCGIREQGDYNQIANYVYTQAEINVRISNQAPKDYMCTVLKQCTGGDQVYGGIDTPEKLNANLSANCIPPELSEMDYTRFKEFLEKRRHLMANKIHQFYMTLK